MIELQNETATALFWQKVKDKAEVGNNFYALKLKAGNKTTKLILLEESKYDSKLYSTYFYADKFAKLKRDGYYDKNIIVKKIKYILENRAFKEYLLPHRHSQLLTGVKISPKLELIQEILEMDER